MKDKEHYIKAGRLGGLATANIYGSRFYETIGAKGGRASNGKFRKGDPRAIEAGRKGGKASAKSKSIH